jgi:hypothetical protein
MRKIIAALQVSVDGFIEGPKGELDIASPVSTSERRLIAPGRPGTAR